MPEIRLHHLNDVKLVGRLTRDPDLRYTPAGQPVCRMRLAVSRKYRDKNSNEWKEEVAFIPVVVWRSVAERCGNRLKKGYPVYVEGRLRSRDWETKEGQKRSDVEVEGWRVQFLYKLGEEGEVEAGSAVSVEDADSAPRVAESESASEGLNPVTAPAAEETEEVPF